MNDIDFAAARRALVALSSSIAFVSGFCFAATMAGWILSHHVMPIVTDVGRGFEAVGRALAAFGDPKLALTTAGRAASLKRRCRSSPRMGAM